MWKKFKYYDIASFNQTYPDISGYGREELMNEVRDTYTGVARYKKSSDGLWVVEEYSNGEWYSIDMEFKPSNYLCKRTNKMANPNNDYAYHLPTFRQYWILDAILKNEKDNEFNSFDTNNNAKILTTGKSIFNFLMLNSHRKIMDDNRLVKAKFVNEAILEKLERDGLLTDQNE